MLRIPEPESVVITSRTDYELGALGNTVATYDDGALGQANELHHEFVPTKSGDGTVVEWNDYYAYGAVRDKWSLADGRWKYLGKELDDETATQHLDAREYDPLVGFIQLDRFAFKYPSLSPYSYGAQNPFRYIDPSGDTVLVRDGDKTLIYSVGMKYDGENKTVKTLIETLNKLGSTEAGETVLDVNDELELNEKRK